MDLANTYDLLCEMPATGYTKAKEINENNELLVYKTHYFVNGRHKLTVITTKRKDI